MLISYNRTNKNYFSEINNKNGFNKECKRNFTRFW